MALTSLIPAAIGVLGSLFGGGKGKASERLPDILRTSQGKDIVDYLMSMYKQPTAGNYLTNMGAYSLMNQFYPQAGYQMPTNPQTTTTTSAGKTARASSGTKAGTLSKWV
jgi:hypothetical protein